MTKRKIMDVRGDPQFPDDPETYWTFEVKYRARNSTQVQTHDQSVACEDEAEAQRWMEQVVREKKADGATIVSARTYEDFT